MDANRRNQFALLIGRLMVGGMYLYSGITNLIELGGKAGYAASKGLPEAQLWVTLASLLLVVAGVSLISGIQPRLGVGAVALFLIPVTLIMHNFWALDGMERITEMHAFLGNLALLGSAFMFLAIPRPWPLSLDNGVDLIDAVLRRMRALNAARHDSQLTSRNS
jgi:putative oxidoreductase